VARTELEAARTDVCITQSELKALEPRLSASPKLPTSMLLSFGAAWQESWQACCLREREWRDVVGTGILGLIQMCWDGNLIAVQRLLDDGPDPNTVERGTATTATDSSHDRRVPDALRMRQEPSLVQRGRAAAAGSRC